MIEEQKLLDVSVAELAGRVTAMKNDGFRLVQIGCTRIETQIEVNYSFDRQYEFVNLRVLVPAENAVLPSMSGIYLSAFLYENEIHDLFGINVKDMALDYKGNFYRTAQKAAFNVAPVSAAAPVKPEQPEKKDA